MLDNRARRRQLITEIEALRGSRLITYVTSDRDNCQGQIDENVVRPMYDHLLELSGDVADGAELPQLDLFLYSRGGAVDAPWRIVSMIRAVAEGFTVIVPFRAQSAATMITLGADQIVLGRKGELGPIDPSLGVQRQGAGGALIDDRINVEDVMSYVKFVRDKAGITDQSGLAAALAALTEYPGPLILGNIYRTHSHIRSVAEKLLESRERPFDDQKNQSLINTLAERTYAHGHAIGRKEATDMGLPVIAPEPELERLMWELFVEYERALSLNDPVDPVAYLDGAGERSEPVDAGARRIGMGSEHLRRLAHRQGRPQRARSARHRPQPARANARLVHPGSSERDRKTRRFRSSSRRCRNICSKRSSNPYATRSHARRPWSTTQSASPDSSGRNANRRPRPLLRSRPRLRRPRGRVARPRRAFRRTRRRRAKLSAGRPQHPPAVASVLGYRRHCRRCREAQGW